MRLPIFWILIGALSASPGLLQAEDSPLQNLTRLLVGDFFSAEMRHDGPGGELYRQRAYLFDTAAETPIVMKALTFDDQSAASVLANDPTAWVKQNLATKPALVDGCDTHWVRDGEGFVGSVDPATCIITGKRGDRRRIESKTLITTKAVGQLERGYDIDGNLLFGNAGGELYIWPRVK